MKNSYSVLILVLFAAFLAAEVTALFVLDFWGMPRNSPAKFFSAAACYRPGEPLRVDLEQMKQFAEMSYKECANFHFTDSEDAVPIYLTDTGLIYGILISKSLFPWLGDVWALRALHLTLHLTMCVTIFFLLRETWKGCAFLVFYGLNPLIVFLTYDAFYYFWPATVSFSILVLLLTRNQPEQKRDVLPYFLAVMNVVNCISLLIRPTILPLAVFFVVLCWWYGYRKTALVNFAVAAGLLFVLYLPGGRNPWHTAAVGVGAYPNPYGHVNGDKQGFEIYRKATGKIYDNSCIKGYLGSAFDEGIQREYSQVTRDFFFKAVKEYPLMMIRNAVLNTLQGYAIGHSSRLPFWMSIVLAGAGVVSIAILLWSRQYVIVLAVLGANILFTPYTPPIATYMFGAYILLVVGWIEALDFFLRRRATARTAE